MALNIPEKFHQLFVLVGIALLTYSSIKFDQKLEKLDSPINKSILYSDSIALISERLENSEKKIQFVSKLNSVYFNIENPLNAKSIFEIYEKRNLSPKDIKLREKLIKLQEERFDILLKKSEYLKMSEHFLKADADEIEKISNEHFTESIIIFFSIILIVIGIILWHIKEQGITVLIENRCQSCAKKFNSLTQPGTMKNGKYNLAYCDECFNEGKFLNPQLTPEIVATQYSITTGESFEKILKKVQCLRRWKLKLY